MAATLLSPQAEPESSARGGRWIDHWDPEDALEQTRPGQRGRRVVVAAYLLATGHFHGRLLQAGADLVTDPLVTAPAVDARLVRLVLQRAASSAPPRGGPEDLVPI